MAHVDITGTQHYALGIGQPKTDVNSSSPATWTDATYTSLATANGGSITVANTYTWAQLQALTGQISGNRAYVSDFGNSEFIYDGVRWKPLNPVNLLSSGIPFVMQSSGNFTTIAGVFTVSQTFGYVVGPCYCYFPANAINASSASGWYYCNLTSATGGTCYNYIYTAGTPVIPTAPPAIVSVVAGFTQQTAQTLNGPAISIPANLMGINGGLDFDATWANAGTTGTTMGAVLGSNGFALALNPGTSPTYKTSSSLRNRGVANAQVAFNIFNTNSFGSGSAANRYNTIDTTTAQTASHQLQISGASQWLICESYSITLRP